MEKTIVDFAASNLVAGAPEIGAPKMGIKRGPEDWAYFSTVLAFVVAVEGTIIGMMPLQFPLNATLFFVFAAITAWQIIDNGRVHNKLLGLRMKYQNKFR
jgi:hypothetical protein